MAKDKDTDTIDQQDAAANENTGGQQFVEEYQALCDKHDVQIAGIPTYQLQQDGTFTTAVELRVVRRNGTEEQDTKEDQ